MKGNTHEYDEESVCAGGAAGDADAAERALLRLAEGLAATALVAALPIVAQALSDGTLNWGNVARTAFAAATVAVLLALVKYARAFGDPPLEGGVAAAER